MSRQDAVAKGICLFQGMVVQSILEQSIRYYDWGNDMKLREEPMKLYRVTSLAAMTAILALSACATKRELPSAGDLVELPLFINGQPLDRILSDPAATRKILTELFGAKVASDESRGELRKKLKALDQGKSDEPAFRGVAGYSTAELLKSIANPKVMRRTKGLIGDYLVYIDKNKPKKKGRGHITVDMRTEIFLTAASLIRDEPDRIERLQWHIAVLGDAPYDGFEVRERQGDAVNDPNNPFPGTVIFPDFSLDPEDERGIWQRELNRKLWAKGKEIVVRHIFKQVDGGRIERLENDHQFYQRTDESCIDMMTKGFPPVFRVDFPEQSGYCLGRCAQPYIMNSM